MVIHHLRFVFLATCHLQIVAAQTSPDHPQYANFSASVTVIIFLVVTSVLFAGFFAIYFRHCADRSSASGGTVRPITGIRNTARGLDATLIETFPTFPYSEVKHLKIGKGALECAVCLNEFEDEETLRLLPKCDHVFHSECIDAWLSSHATCPVCRANLAEVPVETTLPVESDVPSPPGSVSIQVAEEEEVVNAADDGGSVNRARPVKSRSIKSMIFSKFPRSHSTGHSLVRPGENVNRFTLRLPDQVRREIMARALNRTTSLLVLPRETSSRRGYRTDGEGSSRGKSYWRLGSLDRPYRWVFSMTPPFLARESSITSQKKNRSTSGGQGSSKRFNLVGRLSFNRFGGSRSEPGS